jgi:hypothetical protein
VVLEKDGEDQLDRSCGNGLKDGRNIRKTLKRRQADWSGYILRWNCLPKHGVEGKIARRIEVMGRREEDVSSYWMTLRKKKRIQEIERGSARSHSTENWLWERLCRGNECITLLWVRYSFENALYLYLSLSLSHLIVPAGGINRCI